MHKESDSSPIWMMRRLDCARRRAAEQLFAEKPLQKPAQHFLLFEVERFSQAGTPPTQGELAHRMQLAPATMTASLSYLERLGYISRQSDARDLRKNRVVITEAGTQAAEECRRSMEQLELSMFRGFSEEELASLAAFVRRMEDNLNNILKEDSET